MRGLHVAARHPMIAIVPMFIVAADPDSALKGNCRAHLDLSGRWRCTHQDWRWYTYSGSTAAEKCHK